MSYSFHSIFCAAPLDVQQEHDAFYEKVAEFNENRAMTKDVLFVALSILPRVSRVEAIQSAIDENLRSCRHYVQIIGEGWGPSGRNFEASFRLAMLCAADPALPMREVALFRKSTSPAPVPGGEYLRVIDYSSLESFKDQLDGLLAGWLDSVPRTES